MELTNSDRLKIMKEALGNAQMTYIVTGANMTAAMESCQMSHTFAPLSEARALYVGAFMDTIDRLRKG